MVQFQLISLDGVKFCPKSSSTAAQHHFWPALGRPLATYFINWGGLLTEGGGYLRIRELAHETASMAFVCLQPVNLLRISGLWVLPPSRGASLVQTTMKEHVVIAK